MTVRDVRIYPDPVLKQVRRPVGRSTTTRARSRDDLVDTMRAHERCVGIAANQIGALRRCVVVDVTGHPKAKSCSGLLVLFDPGGRVELRGPRSRAKGCLSLPDLTANVRRATDVVVRGLDLDGGECAIDADAFEARALLHEIDHLDGVLFLDRVTSLATDVFRRKG